MNVRHRVALIALFAALCGARANAAVETCGAHLRALVAMPSAPGEPAMFGYLLRADTARSVEGAIIADTSTGWYAWLFPITPLAPHPDTLTPGGGLTLNGSDFESKPLFVSFPPGTTIAHAWVTSAKTLGETFFGFDARGTESCPIPDFEPRDQARGLPALPKAVPSGETVVAAKPTDDPFTLKCARPFAGLEMGDVPPPSVNIYSGPRVQTIAALAVDDKGRVLDDWLIGASGNVAWDRDVLARLRVVKYTAPVSYCRPVPTIIYIVLSSGR